MMPFRVPDVSCARQSLIIFWKAIELQGTLDAGICVAMLLKFTVSASTLELSEPGATTAVV